MYYVVSYDVNGKQSEVHAACLKGNFYDSVKGSDGKYGRLPNTTLILKSVSLSSAEKEFRDIVKSVDSKIKITKIAIIPTSSLGSCKFDSDECITLP